MGADEAAIVTNVPTKALSHLPLAIVLSNPRLEDNPIVYANSAFTRLTGYPVTEVIGKNCRFLQGPATEPDRLERLRAAVAGGEDITLEITNHRADGTPFVNRLSVTPLTEGAETEYFLGTMGLPSSDDTRLEQVEAQILEINHRVKNHLALIISMVRMHARNPGTATDYAVLSSRIEALQLLYEELSEAGVSNTSKPEVPLGAYVSRLAASIGHLDGRQGVRVNVIADEVMVDAATAGRVGLLVSELLTNAFRHAFVDRDAGLVETRLQQLSSGVVRIQITDDGVGLPEGHVWPSGGNLGSRIVQSLLAGLEARHSVDSATTGTTFTIDLPAPDVPEAEQ